MHTHWLDPVATCTGPAGNTPGWVMSTPATHLRWPASDPHGHTNPPDAHKAAVQFPCHQHTTRWHHAGHPIPRLQPHDTCPPRTTPPRSYSIDGEACMVSPGLRMGPVPRASPPGNLRSVWETPGGWLPSIAGSFGVSSQLNGLCHWHTSTRSTFCHFCALSPSLCLDDLRNNDCTRARRAK